MFALNLLFGLYTGKTNRLNPPEVRIGYSTVNLNEKVDFIQIKNFTKRHR